MNEILRVNYVAVLVAAIINMVIGSLWYGPVFGKTWSKLSRISRENKDPSKMTGSDWYWELGSKIG